MKLHMWIQNDATICSVHKNDKSSFLSLWVTSSSLNFESCDCPSFRIALELLNIKRRLHRLQHDVTSQA